MSASTTSNKDIMTSSVISATYICHVSSLVRNTLRAVSDTALSTAMQIQSKGSTKVFSNTWTYQGCYTEGTNARALPSSTYASDSMTLESCAAFCEGSYMMGVEYERECYCSDLLSTGSVQTPNQADCSMLCKGNATESCGGASLLQLYFAAIPTSGSPITIGSPQNPIISIIITSTIDFCAATTLSSMRGAATSSRTSNASSTYTIIVPAVSTASNPSPSPTSLPITFTKHDTGLATSAKAGIGIGVSLAVILIALAGLFFLRRKSLPHLSHIWQRNNSDTNTTTHPSLLSISPVYHKPVCFPRQNKKLQGDSDHSREVFVDHKGVVWPQEVKLKGEAKALREWTKAYAKDSKVHIGLRTCDSEEATRSARQGEEDLTGYKMRMGLRTGGAEEAASSAGQGEDGLTGYKIRMGLRTGSTEEAESSAGQGGDNMTSDRSGAGGMATQEVEDSVQERVSPAKRARRARQKEFNRRRGDLPAWV